MDVLVGRISLFQFIFSIKNIEKNAQGIIDVLKSNEDQYKEIFIHTFSAGGAMWGLCQRLIKRVRFKNILSDFSLNNF